MHKLSFHLWMISVVKMVLHYLLLMLSLTGGITYGLSIVNENVEWFWLSSAGSEEHFFRTPPGDPQWALASSDNDLAFELIHAVPAPSALALITLGVLIVPFAGRRLGQSTTRS